LLESNFPVNLLFNWYCKTYNMVKWNNSLSRVIHVCSGITQTDLFCLTYIHRMTLTPL